MAITHGVNLYFAVSTPSGGAMTALSAYTREVNDLPGEQDLGDITVAGNVGYTYYPGLQKASFTSVHVLDTATTGAWELFDSFQSLQQTNPTTAWGIQYGPNGSTATYPLITCNAYIKSISFPNKVTDPGIFTVNWEMSAGTTGVTVGVVS